MRLLFLIFLLGIKFASFSQDAAQVAKSCLPSSVSILMEDRFKQPLSLGSGFIIENGKIVTNLHVIEDAKYGYVILSGSSVKHQIDGYFAVDRENDLAILSVPTLQGKGIPFSATNVEVGTRIYAIGNPKGLSGTISEGIVSGLRTLNDKELIQITAPISPGSSGGAVVNSRGELVGVAVGTITAGQNLNFAIPLASLKNLINHQSKSVLSLNIDKGSAKPKVSDSEEDVSSGVIIRNMQYEKFVMVGTCLSEISIRNKLPYAVKDVEALFILYDEENIPIDTYKKTFYEEIMPFLAKSHSWNSAACNNLRVLRLQEGERLEIRILSFEVLKE